MPHLADLLLSNAHGLWAIAGAALPGFRPDQAPESFDAAAEAAKLLAVEAEWSACAFAAKDVTKVISYWSDDAAIYPPGMPMVRTKEGHRQLVTSMYAIPGFKISWKSRDPVFFDAGRNAYMSGEVETTMLGSDGKPTTTRSRSITIWRKDADGRWRCTCDIWNDAPKAAGMGADQAAE